jgi:chloramphenicol-sensitive protein RarD
VIAARGGGQLGHAAAGTQLILASSGLVTILPLLLFTSAARRLPLSTLGFLQYLAPTGQLVLAVAYGEPLPGARLIAFGLIWLGLAVFTADLIGAARAAPVSRTDR